MPLQPGDLPFEWVVSKVAAGTSDDVKTDRVPDGWVYTAENIAVEDETSGYTTLRLLKDGPGGEVHYCEEEGPLAGLLYFTTDHMHLTEGEQVVARLVGTTASDVLKLYVAGVRRRLVGG